VDETLLAPRLRARLEAFNQRNLTDRSWMYLYLDALFLKVRLAGKVVIVPVLAALRVDQNGQKELLTLSLWSRQNTGAWFWVCQALRDGSAIIYAESANLIRRAYSGFVKKRQTKLTEAVASLQEGGEELLTFLRYPKRQWKALRTTNTLERLNQEFRRRVKVQGSLPDSQTAVALLAALWEDGCITYRRFDGHKDLQAVLKERSIKQTAEADLDKVA